ncbi:hypothetical protein DFS34DRAFT_622754 [Phlyctochytrium arcticum]|nr:hypothetical protein DFS34DRAFT_622754 [Phlyctochytrium arcticum]
MFQGMFIPFFSADMIDLMFIPGIYIKNDGDKTTRTYNNLGEVRECREIGKNKVFWFLGVGRVSLVEQQQALRTPQRSLAVYKSDRKQHLLAFRNQTKTMTDSLTLYDISSPLQPHSFAPNPTKSRLALTFKRVAFTTSWTEQLDIPSVRQSLSCPATRSLDDGSEYYTLPNLVHVKNGERVVVGDSFEIAHYLQSTFPDSGVDLFPSDSTGTGLDYQSPAINTPFNPPLTTNAGHPNRLYANFNLHVDATFTAHTLLVVSNIPFNPSTAAATKALMMSRVGISAWEEWSLTGEKRQTALRDFRESVESLAGLYKKKEGPYLEGMKVSYADLCVGGWLNFYEICLPGEEWRGVKGWYGGVFGRLVDALKMEEEAGKVN